MCYCGKPGCVEHSYSLPVLLRRISDAPDGRIYSLPQEKADPAHLTVKDVWQHPKPGICCAGIISSKLLNPSMIVLYGHMLSLGDYFLTELKTAINENVCPKSRVSEDRIVVSPDLQDQLPLGAISELFAGYLKNEDFNWVYQLPQITAL